MVDHFPYIKDQKGTMVFVNGKMEGLDVISLSSAYKVLHEKLIKSYVLDAISYSY